MVKILFFVLTIVLSVKAMAQNIDINFYSTGSGRNITAAYSKEVNKSIYGIGLGYNIGRIKQPDDQNNIFYKRLYPTQPIHYLNFNAYYNYIFYDQMKCIKPMLFYDLQMKYSTTRSSMYIIHKYDSTLTSDNPNENLLYRNFIEYFGPYLWVENSIGFGFKIDITDKIYLKEKTGLGLVLIFGEDKRLPLSNPEWEFYGLINIGLGVKIKGP